MWQQGLKKGDEFSFSATQAPCSTLFYFVARFIPLFTFLHLKLKQNDEFSFSKMYATRFTFSLYDQDCFICFLFYRLTFTSGFIFSFFLYSLEILTVTSYVTR